MNRIAASFQGEIRRIGFAVYRDVLKHAGVLAGRRQNAADAVEYSKIRVLEAIVARDRGGARIVALPRPEAPGRVNNSGRLRVG